jgi:UPF0716 protein FxsA
MTRYPIRELVKRFVVRPYLDKRTGGFVTGEVWTGGFPQDDTVDVDPENYRFETDDS